MPGIEGLLDEKGALPVQFFYQNFNLDKQVAPNLLILGASAKTLPE